MAHSIVALAEEVALWTTANCQPFEPGFIAHTLAATRYTGVLTSLLLYVASIRYCEVYLLLFGVGTSINTVVNLSLRAIAADSTRASPLCADVYEFGGGNWPSFQTQDAAFITVFLSTYAVIYRPAPYFIGALLLMLFYAAVVAGDLLLNYHTKSQIASAVVAGAATAFLWQLMLRFAFMPLVPAILHWPPAAYLGYQETLCYDSRAKQE